MDDPGEDNIQNIIQEIDHLEKELDEDAPQDSSPEEEVEESFGPVAEIPKEEASKGSGMVVEDFSMTFSIGGRNCRLKIEEGGTRLEMDGMRLELEPSGLHLTMDGGVDMILPWSIGDKKAA